MVETLVLAVHVLLAAGIIGLVLLQQGKGAEAGAAFGGGASQTVFGSQGSSSFLGRMTGILAAALFVTSFVLAVYAKDKAVAVTEAGIPSAEVVEQVQGGSALPELKDDKVAAPADADVPKAN